MTRTQGAGVGRVSNEDNPPPREHRPRAEGNVSHQSRRNGSERGFWARQMHSYGNRRPVKMLLKDTFLTEVRCG